MTAAQEKKVEELRSSIVFKLNGMDREIKEFSVEDHQYFVSVYVIFGYIDEESRWYKYFPIRDHAHFFVGPRGGLTYPIWKSRDKMIRRPCKPNDLLKVEAEQKKLAYSTYI